MIQNESTEHLLSIGKSSQDLCKLEWRKKRPENIQSSEK